MPLFASIRQGARAGSAEPGSDGYRSGSEPPGGGNRSKESLLVVTARCARAGRVHYTCLRGAWLSHMEVRSAESRMHALLASRGAGRACRVCVPDPTRAARSRRRAHPRRRRRLWPKRRTSCGMRCRSRRSRRSRSWPRWVGSRSALDTLHVCRGGSAGVQGCGRSGTWASSRWHSELLWVAGRGVCQVYGHGLEAAAQVPPAVGGAPCTAAMRSWLLAGADGEEKAGEGAACLRRICSA